MEKKLDGNYTRMLPAILNKPRRQHSTKQLLYDHLPPITKTIKIRRTRHAERCWRSRAELISDVVLWTPTHGWAKVGRPARTYTLQLCADTGFSPEDLSEAMDDRGSGERGSGISAQIAWHDDDDDGIYLSIIFFLSFVLFFFLVCSNQYICLSLIISMYVFIYLSKFVCVLLFILVSSDISTFINQPFFFFLCLFLSIYMSQCLHIYIYIYIYMCVSVCVCVLFCQSLCWLNFWNEASRFSDYVSGLLQVFLGKLGSLQKTSNHVFYLINTCLDSVNHNREQMWSIPVLLLAYSQDWTISIQIIVP